MRTFVLALILASAGVDAATVAYTIDPAHTQVQVSWNHLNFSNPEAGFDAVSGTLQWDADDITRSSVSVVLGVDSIHSHVPALDEKLVSAEFLDRERFPTITFASSAVERAGDDGRLRIRGNLTVHGVTRPVELDARLNHVGRYPMLDVPAAGFDATAVIRRSDFGVVAGIPYVGDELKVRITVEALEAAGYAKAMKALAEQGNETGGKS